MHDHENGISIQPATGCLEGTIAGFVFQVHSTIFWWLSLDDGELVELERGEDIDIVQAELAEGPINADRVLEQTKRRTSGDATLNSPGVGEHDPVTMIAVAVTLAVVSLVACYVPARRATKVALTMALRSE